MNVTSPLRAPVLSILSTSSALSRRSQEFLLNYFSLEPIALSGIDENDELNKQFACTIPGMSTEWESVASKCKYSGTIVHFLSMKSSRQTTKYDNLALLSVADDFIATNDQCSVISARDLLVSHMSNMAYGKITGILLSHAVSRPTTVSDLLSFGGGLPLLKLGQHAENTMSSSDNGGQISKGLREVTFPVYDDAKYQDGSTLLSNFSASNLTRPVVGLYQFPNNGVALRPLPAAKEDRLLPKPSLIFYTPNLDEVKEKLRTDGISTAKIGYNGTSEHGQLMILHHDTPGLDIRLTESTTFTSSFSEAQEALLAGSLDDLQHVNVLIEGGKGAHSRSDSMNGLADCWVEFRANVRQPSGFFNRRNTNAREGRQRIAKAPDIPYD